MTALNRKLVRDLWHIKGQAVAICLILACGVATFVMSLATLESLQLAQQTYYERYRFGHVFAHLKRAPRTLTDRLAEIPGVSRVQTRVVVEVTLDVPGLAEPAVGRLISVSERPAPQLNDLHLRSGRYLEAGNRGEVLASEAFAVANGLAPGDKVRAVLNGRRQELTIVGVVISPEYVYQIRGGDFVPDDRRFGVFWMQYRELAAAFDMQGAFNDVSLALMPGASEPEVLARIDRLTEPFGGLGAYGRGDQVSHRYVSDEIEQLRAMTLIPPAIFLSVAVFLVNVVISRLIGTQREQIAALKAFGYTRWEVGGHYLQMVLLIAIVSVFLGTAIGARLGHDLTSLYTRFFRFPIFEFHLNPATVMLALAVSAATAVVGALRSVRRAARLPPAEAMRPEPPATYQPTLIERWGFSRLFSPSARMVLRTLERQPWRAALTAFGISLAVAVLILGNFTVDAIDYLLDLEFYIRQRQDVSVTFVEPVSARAQHDLEHLPGVLYCEPLRMVSTRLRAGHRSRRIGILGIAPSARLRRLLDANLHAVPLPPEGLVLSEKLAELLHVGVGDTLLVEVLEGSRPVREVPVTGLVSELVGTSAYMDLQALQRLLREAPTLSGALLSVDGRRLVDLYRVLKTIPRVAGVIVKQVSLRSFEETFAENLLRMKTINVIFASIIAVGVVYNSARISLSERSRELASLRVLGFTRAEISAILLGELAVLTLAAIPVGLAIGYGFAAFATLMTDTETHRIPLVINRSTYAFAVTVVLAAAVVSGLGVRRSLDRLDLVAVLKSQE